MTDSILFDSVKGDSTSFSSASIEDIQRRIDEKELACLDCNGKGKSVAFINTGLDSSKHYSDVLTCDRCNGSGEVSVEQLGAIIEGKKLRQERVSQGLTLKQMAEKMNCSSAKISQMELGK
ncbi:hypothetical protein [Vibrio owensii]|uniref:helix-turn-helix domain-containing protein n=1 Tax=Vibrio harveyi group TaxID=717610 RepID=UPI003CC559B6